MKAVILAAGMGTRLGKYTKKMPKGMLPVGGKTLISRQLKILRNAGIEEIILVTGHFGETITYPGVRYYHNPNYASGNMLETLVCAREELDSDILVVYSDIIFESRLAQRMINNTHPIAVAVDAAWEKYWQLRYDSVETDLESLIVSKDGRIVDIGKTINSPLEMQYRYIGLVKFSQTAISKALGYYDLKKEVSENWPSSGRHFQQGYMTDLLQELIDSGVEVLPIITENGWLEFDTVDDYEKISAMIDNGTISQLIDLETE